MGAMKTPNPILKTFRRLLVAAALFGVSLELRALPTPLQNRQATLEAIHQVENPRDVRRPGPCGELGAYQFRRDTWQTHTTRPFSDALDRQASDEVATQHYEWLRRGLTRGGFEPSTYNIALAWNAGLRAVLRQRVPARSHFYAERVVNLAGEFDRSLQLASTQ